MSKTKKQTSKTPYVKAKIDRIVDREDSAIKAIASVTVDNAFSVHGIKIMDSDKYGTFVSMPNTKYEKNGKPVYSDVFHAVTAEARTALNDAVLEAYQLKLEQVESNTDNMEMQM